MKDDATQKAVTETEATGVAAVSDSRPLTGSVSGDDVAMQMAHTLTVLLLDALEQLGAPKETIEAITESGDMEHVQWWLEQKKAQNVGFSDRAN